MDTKSKNIKYSLGSKVIAVIILWVSLIGGLGSGVFLLLNFNTDAIRVERYEDTHDFQMTISRLVHNVVELNTTLKDIDETKEREDVSITDEGVDNEAVTEFTESEITEENPINEKRIRVAAINKNLSRAVNFNYYIRNIKTGEVSFKIADGSNPELIKDHPNHIYVNKNEIPYYLHYYGDIQEMLMDSPHEMYVLINDVLLPGDDFYEGFNLYTEVKELIPYAIGTLIGTLTLLTLSLGYLIMVSGRREKGGEVHLADIDKIYNDIQSLFVLFAAGISMIIVSNIHFSNSGYTPGIIVVIITFAIDAAIGMTYFFSMLRQFKKGVLLKNTLVYKVFSSVINLARNCFNDKIFKPWVLALMLAYGLINGILFIVAIDQEWLIYPLFIIPFNGFAVHMAFKRLKSLTLIMEAAKEISQGNLDHQLDNTEVSLEFSSFAKDIQSIQGGLRNAVNEAIKGERMKTDLVTNVSHDLKTPLTSIINYVDLLEQEEINNETARGYLEILNEKSYRLKQLIEDLIEASKASSGNLAITKEEVDLHELITQACGEYEEKIGEAQLDIRINAPEEKTIILADGKYMWRIVENIMSNALKYSMPNSRIYIDIERDKGYGVLTMKNMSAYPLDIDPNELTERFTRVDESRTTEGSGLGLSIAQSLTGIQDGTFNIAIDGDLFKVTIAMPLGTVH